MKKWIALTTLLLSACLVRAGVDQQTKLKTLTLPSLAYRAAPLSEILEDIRQKAIQADPTHSGVNFIIKLDEKTLRQPITLNLHKPELGRALALVSSVAGIQMRVDRAAVVFSPGRALTP